MRALVKRSPSLKGSKKNPLTMQGFTMIELIAVILLVSILAVFAYPSWQNRGINVHSQATQLVNDLRYTQSLSIASSQHYYLIITGRNSYQIRNESGTPEVLSAGNTTVFLGTGISFGTLTNCPNSLIMFDGQGAPYVSTGGTALTATAVIPLVSDNETYSVVVNPVTGAASLQ